MPLLGVPVFHPDAPDRAGLVSGIAEVWLLTGPFVQHLTDRIYRLRVLNVTGDRDHAVFGLVLVPEIIEHCLPGDLGHAFFTTGDVSSQRMAGPQKLVNKLSRFL
jgi:hypothetical protein